MRPPSSHLLAPGAGEGPATLRQEPECLLVTNHLWFVPASGTPEVSDNLSRGRREREGLTWHREPDLVKETRAGAAMAGKAANRSFSPGCSHSLRLPSGEAAGRPQRRARHRVPTASGVHHE